ncbi:MAG: hypothetical protein QOK37_3769 [Thermoanaerobaculia bacterium]|jgi:hypothetical protein|nr:hypothetical protein [Thermoanaerobaculia bacterium]
MFKKVADMLDEDEIAQRSNMLNELAVRLHEHAGEMGFLGEDEGCQTVCEERLVVENGRLVRKIVCHIVCPT